MHKMNPKFCFSFCVILLVVPLLLTFLVPLITVQDDLTQDQQHIRREFIVQLARNAWNNSLGKVSPQFIFTSASTLWLMNLTDEYAQAHKWTNNQNQLWNNSTQLTIDFPHVVSEFIGSFLSCYALTKNGIFLDKAEMVAHALNKLYNSSNSIDSLYITQYWSNQRLEYAFLGSIFPGRKFDERLRQIESQLGNVNYLKSYYSQLIDGLDVLYLGVLVKSYIQSNETKFLYQFNRLMSSAEQDGLILTTKSGLTYIRNLENDGSHYMTDRDCALASILALASLRMRTTFGSLIATKYLNLSIALTETCHFAWSGSKSRIPQSYFYIKPNESSIEQTFKREESVASFANSMMAETYFVLYRATHAQKYRDYAWELVEAIGKSCTTNGKTRNVNQNPPTTQKCEQSVTFLSQTLKYLYLTFTDDDFLSLDKWVFTASGQPLPILVQWNLTKSN